MNLRRAATFVLAWLLTAGTAQIAGAQQQAQNQQGQRDCVLRKEPNGLIRGRNQPKGCVLVQEKEVTSQQAPTGPAIVCGERIIYTPNPTRTVLANCARLSGGRMVIPTVPPSEEVVEERHFGPLFRHFGPIQSNFGPLERHFGPLERHFGPLERNFGSSSQKKSGGKRP
jgi:hypothetical protein